MHRSRSLALVLLFALCCVGESIAYDVVVPTIYGDIGGLGTDVGYPLLLLPPSITPLPLTIPASSTLQLRVHLGALCQAPYRQPSHESSPGT